MVPKLEFFNILFRNLKNESYHTANLSKKDINYIENLIINRPNIIYNIYDKLDNIVITNIIKIYDIPDIVISLFETYNSDIENNNIKGIDIINVIEFTLDSIFDQSVLNLSDIDIKNIKKITKSSLKLLNYNSNNIENNNCCFL